MKIERSMLFTEIPCKEVSTERICTNFQRMAMQTRHYGLTESFVNQESEHINTHLISS